MIELKMKMDKETKGSVRYAETGPPEEQTLRTVYVRKSAFDGKYPQEITVTVKW